PLATPQGWKEDASETVCARNSPCQDDERAVVRARELPVKRQPGQVAGRSEPAVLPSTQGSTRHTPLVVGFVLAADWCVAFVDALPLSSTSPSSADCRLHCAAPAWD